MNKLTKFIKDKYAEILWYFNGDRWMREYDEEQQRMREAEAKALEEYYAQQEREEEEQHRQAEKASLEARLEKIDEKFYQEYFSQIQDDRYSCPDCGNFQCSCDEDPRDYLQ